MFSINLFSINSASIPGRHSGPIQSSEIIAAMSSEPRGRAVQYGVNPLSQFLRYNTQNLEGRTTMKIRTNVKAGGYGIGG
jgi:hypothetical protein